MLNCANHLQWQSENEGESPKGNERTCLLNEAAICSGIIEDDEKRAQTFKRRV